MLLNANSLILIKGELTGRLKLDRLFSLAGAAGFSLKIDIYIIFYAYAEQLGFLILVSYYH